MEYTGIIAHGESLCASSVAQVPRKQAAPTTFNETHYVSYKGVTLHPYIVLKILIGDTPDMVVVQKSKRLGPSRHKGPGFVKVYRSEFRDLGYRVNFSTSSRRITENPTKEKLVFCVKPD